MALQSVLKTFSAQIPWGDLNDNINKKQSISLDHFVGSTPSLLVAKLAEKYDQVVVIHGDPESAQFMQGDL